VTPVFLIRVDLELALLQLVPDPLAVARVTGSVAISLLPEVPGVIAPPWASPQWCGVLRRLSERGLAWPGATVHSARAAVAAMAATIVCSPRVRAPLSLSLSIFLSLLSFFSIL
jgi:hypothetical protein